MYINAHKSRLNWIHYTALIGFLPIAIRFVVSVSDPSGGIFPFVIGDVVFWGIVLNTAAIYNVSMMDKLPDVQVSVTAFAFMRSALLVAVYTVALFPGFSHAILWFVASILIGCSFAGSLFATDSIRMQRAQKLYDLANKIERLPFTERSQAKVIIDRVLEDPDSVDTDAEFDKCFAHLDKTQIDHVHSATTH